MAKYIYKVTTKHSANPRLNTEQYFTALYKAVKSVPQVSYNRLTRIFVKLDLIHESKGITGILFHFKAPSITIKIEKILPY